MPIHVVQTGESIYSIANEYGVDTESIIYNNQIEYPDLLTVGQALLILTDYKNVNRSIMQTNGYAYPFINEQVLDETLPFLTQLSIFSYGFTESGYLISPELDASFMLQAAYEKETMAILTLTPFGSDGLFSNYLIHIICNNQEAQENLIMQLIKTVQEKGYGGVNIDFEYILEEDRYVYVDFVRNVTNSLNQLGYLVSVALPPKTSADQPGLLYAGIDYRLLGEVANEVLLMTYEWGYTYGPPMAVAPLHKVQEVLDYAVTEIPRQKINMGIPNYGYDWALPFVRGVSAARPLGNVEAVQLAIVQGVPIYFDETAKSPFFHYMEGDIQHEVWFEDVRSIKAKLELAEIYGFKGVFYWQIMKLFRANWLLLDNILWIRK